MSMRSFYRSGLPLLTLSIGLIWLGHSLQFFNNGMFWDLGIYEKAVAVYNSGGDPYSLNGYLSFVYQPLVLRLMAVFGSSLGIIFIVGYISALGFFLSSLGAKLSWWLYSFLAFAYCGIGAISLGSGNVTAFLHLVLLGILLRSIRNPNITRSYKSFILAVTLFSLIKPYMLAYLLIPLITSSRTKHQKSAWVGVLLAACFVGLVMLCSVLYFGSEFQAFLAAVKGQTLGKRDLGYGLVMYFYDYYLSAGDLIYRAFVLHFAIIGALLVGTLFLAIRNKQIHQPSFTLLLYFLLTILNPRLKVYDLFPALIALFIYVAAFQKSAPIRILFVLAYALSLSQLAGSTLFAHSGILSAPLNVYYLTMGIIFACALSTLVNNKKPFEKMNSVL